MKNICDKFYYFISQQLARIFVFVGLGCYAAYIFVGFLGGMINTPEEALYYFVSLAFSGLVLAGLLFGYLKGNERLLVVALVAFLVIRAQSDFVSSLWGLSFVGNATTTYILHWVFEFLFALAVGTFITFVVLNYFFKLFKLNLALEISFFAVLAFGVLSWIFGIVYAAEGYGWTNGVLPLFLVGAYLFVPGVLEELFPGELEGLPPVQKEAEPEEKAE